MVGGGRFEGFGAFSFGRSPTLVRVGRGGVAHLRGLVWLWLRVCCTSTGRFEGTLESHSSVKRGRRAAASIDAIGSDVKREG